MVSFSFMMSAIINDKLAAIIVGYLIVIFGSMTGTILEGFVFPNYDWRYKPSLLLFPLPLTQFFYTQSVACARQGCFDVSALNYHSEIIAPVIAFYVCPIIYFIIGWYFYNVLPQPWGVRKNPIFCITSFFSCCCKSSSKIETEQDDSTHCSGKLIEDVDVVEERTQVLDNTYTSENCGVLIQNIKKSYGKTKAVKGLMLGIKKHECFGLLGQNGAGTNSFATFTTNR